jgi:hypothetical protein
MPPPSLRVFSLAFSHLRSRGVSGVRGELQVVGSRPAPPMIFALDIELSSAYS